jgi:hypothetical protein
MALDPGHHRARPVRAAMATVRDAIPVTTPTQTLIDLSSVLCRPVLERALSRLPKRCGCSTQRS